MPESSRAVISTGMKLHNPFREKPEGYPWIDHILGSLVGDIIAWIGMRAYRRGDLHEFNHSLAALVIGSSNHTKDERYAACPVPHDRALRPGEDILLHVMPEGPGKS